VTLSPLLDVGGGSRYTNLRYTNTCEFGHLINQILFDDPLGSVDLELTFWSFLFFEYMQWQSCYVDLFRNRLSTTILFAEFELVDVFVNMPAYPASTREVIVFRHKFLTRLQCFVGAE